MKSNNATLRLRNNAKLTREYLNKVGWRQGRLGAFQEPTCLWGALRCLFPENEFLEMCEALAPHMVIMCPKRWIWVRVGVVAWNDVPGRTYEDVKYVLTILEKK